MKPISPSAPRPAPSLWESLATATDGPSGVFLGRDRQVPLGEFATASTLGERLEALRGRSVLLVTQGQLGTAQALLELDGVARRLVLCTPDLDAAQLAQVAATAAAEFVVGEAAPALPPTLELPWIPLASRPAAHAAAASRWASERTEWVLLTSGTSGAPKLVAHTLQSLSGTLPRRTATMAPVVWSTFYDIRRYGGLQIYLRAVLGGSSLVLSCAAEPTADFLSRAAAAGVTHISGTPSHWRRALMSGAAAALRPEYLRLSGEIADQAVLDALRHAYPQSAIGHAFASTEAGVAFDVEDGLEGFPVDYVTQGRAGVRMKIEEDTLRVRSTRNAARYLGESAGALVSADGYVDTGDLVERRGDRYYFRGRRSGVINVGGLKVHPEEVESVLNADPRVRMSLVRAKRSPITGALVAADVVLTDAAREALGETGGAALSGELLAACRRQLAAHKVPNLLRFVPALELTAAGKLVRPHA